MTTTPATDSPAAESGRLATRDLPWPISEDDFGRLAGQWRRSHLWLTLWNAKAKMIAADPQAGRFWKMLWDECPPFRDGLAACARGVLESGAVSRPKGEALATDLGPWHPDLALLAIPVRWHSRTIGVVMAGAVLSHKPTEAFSRLCDQGGLDRAAMLGFARQSGIIPAARLDELAGALALTVEQARAIEQQREECNVLTSNLENTYEELNLIYRVSGQMGLPQRPAEVFRRVGREMLEVSRASAVAFVLTEQFLSDGSWMETRHPDGPSMQDRIVQVGTGAPTLSELDRLAECLDINSETAADQLLLNRAPEQEHLGWTRDWLQHLVVLPLWHKKQLLGALIAINCDDGGDYTSVDVQLLRAVADRVTAFLENQHLYDDLTDLLMGLLHALINSIDAKDPYTCGHSERVAFISRELARLTSLSAAECERVYLAGLMHDVGKIGVPDAVLCKPGKLTKEEFDAMRKHPEIGVRILARVRQIQDLMPGVLYHHERMDGRGYPHGLAGRRIPLLGRVICLADCFDAMTTNRTYRAAMPLPLAVAEIRRCAGTQFDPQLAELFLTLDLERLFREARAGAMGDPMIGQLGVLKADLGTWQETPFGNAETPKRRNVEPGPTPSGAGERVDRPMSVRGP